MTRGEAFYIGLEDSYRRLKARVGDRLLEARERDPAIPDYLHLLTEFPRLDEGGVAALDAWLVAHPRCRLVVIDVLERIAPRRSSRNPHQYAHDYAMLAGLQRLALRRRVAVLVVHHTTKVRYENVLDKVSGTTGLTAAADTVLVLAQSNGSAVLHVQGRDVARQALAVRFAPAVGTWTLVGEAKEHAISPERQAILRALKRVERPMRPAEVADLLGQPRDNIKYLMWRMAQAGTIATRGDGTYIDTTNRPHSTTDTTPAHPAHRPGSQRVSAVCDPSPPPLTIVRPPKAPDVHELPDMARAVSAVSGMGRPPGAGVPPPAAPRWFASADASWKQPDLFPVCGRHSDTDAEFN